MEKQQGISRPAREPGERRARAICPPRPSPRRSPSSPHLCGPAQLRCPSSPVLLSPSSWACQTRPSRKAAQHRPPRGCRESGAVLTCPSIHVGPPFACSCGASLENAAACRSTKPAVACEAAEAAKASQAPRPRVTDVVDCGQCGAGAGDGVAQRVCERRCVHVHREHATRVLGRLVQRGSTQSFRCKNWYGIVER